MGQTVFEHKVCWKCSGRGIIPGYSHVKGGVCFACGGAGFRLTPRGRKDRNAWCAAVDAVALKTAGEVQVGDAVMMIGDSRYARVTKIEVRPNSFGHGDPVVWEDGVSFDLDRKVATLGLPESAPAYCKSHSGFSTSVSNSIYIHQGERMPKAIGFVSIPKKGMTAELAELFVRQHAMG